MTEGRKPGQEEINAAHLDEQPKENVYLKHRDIYKAHATELQNGVAEIQEAKWGISIRKLMERSGDNHRLVTGLNTFLDALMHQAAFGNSQDQLGRGRVEDIADFFEEAAKALRWNVSAGNRPADLKVDLSRWETK